MITVQIPMLNEKWSMPANLKDNLYNFLVSESKGKVVPDTIKQWLESLPNSDKEKVIRAFLYQ